MNLIAFLGRTCTGKSTIARSVAEHYAAPLIGIGDLIRERLAQDAPLAEAYAGTDGFPDQFIHGLLTESLGKINRPLVVVEGSIGLGTAIASLHFDGTISYSVGFLLYCPVHIRRERFEARQAGRARVELQQFFDDRERLFDRRLPADLVELKRIKPLEEIDASCSPAEISAVVFDRLALQGLQKS